MPTFTVAPANTRQAKLESVFNLEILRDYQLIPPRHARRMQRKPACNKLQGLTVLWPFKLTVDLLAGDALNVDHPLLPVDLHDLSLPSLQQCTNARVRRHKVDDPETVAQWVANRHLFLLDGRLPTLYVPRTTLTSSSFLTGTAFTCMTHM